MKAIRMILSVLCMAAALLLCSGCAGNRSLASTPDPTLTLIPLSEAERAKIDPELLAVIEWEEQHPGEGREAAPEDFIFNSRDQVGCIIVLSDEVDVTINSKSREANLETVRKIMAAYGGTVVYESVYSNDTTIMIPLQDMKKLAKEEMVVEIQADHNVRLLDTTP